MSSRIPLEVTLNNWATGKSPSVEVAWENVPFTPPASSVWVSTRFRPADWIAPDIPASDIRENGLFTVTVYGPVNQGAKDTNDIAREVITEFKPGTDLTSGGETVHCDEIRPTVLGISEDGKWYRIAIDVSWWNYKTNT